MQYEFQRFLGRLPAPPLHFLSALVTFLLDAIWWFVERDIVTNAVYTGVDLPALFLVIGSLGLTCFLLVLVIQKFIARDEWPPALGKAMLMGVVGSLPYQLASVFVVVLIFTWWIARLLVRQS